MSESTEIVDTAARRRRSRRGEGDKLRAEIVEAASRMLAETGEVGDLSLRAVAREVGVAATSIYLHFEKLEELVFALKVRYFEQFGAALDAAADAAGDEPLARARARGHAYVEYGMANPGIYRALFTSEMLPARLRPEVGYIGSEVFETARDDIAGVVGPGPHANMLAVHFWTALHGVVTLRTARKWFPWPDLTEQVDDLIKRLVGP